MDFINELEAFLEGLRIDDDDKKTIIEIVSSEVENMKSNLSPLQERLNVLYEYEKNYLELIKNYKEEIKFAITLQEDLRKERTKFFAEDLKKVAQTLQEANVDSKIASIWIKELVDSYTKSLNLSSGLIEEHTLDMLGMIKEQAKKEANEIRTQKQ